MVWIRDVERRYHLVARCPVAAGAGRGDPALCHVKEAEARAMGRARCHHCYGSAGKTV
jgi:hypothetical protein